MSGSATIPPEAEIAAVMELFGFDRMAAINHLRARAILQDNERRRASRC